MQSFLRKILTTAATASAFVLISGTALGQKAKVDVEKPVFDDVPSPDVQINKNKSFKPKNWLEVEAKLNVKMAPAPPSNTCEKLTVKWYVAIANPEKRGTYLLLTKDVDYVNVPLEEDIFVSIYLSPASLKRITGTDRGGKSAVELLGFEVLVNGEVVGQETNKGKVGWWSTSSDKISRSDTVQLLPKSKTPFSMFWWDRYAEEASTTK
ncbi:hypothetical protein JIN85_02085 [Luteolibacter pohnpeiensis]|uniref:Uncharacterized protein n=1 Tax=Luteolibacter pohnpeiensis TaxID=454153 RepID=A0A934VUW5_9BACT|nr:Amuc_1102 family pilus-like protein [Luteolibacter pohnpeiensis]MBK1881183.1 hypothetical protein [Luteolibacter pohnpeiensis]